MADLSYEGQMTLSYIMHLEQALALNPPGKKGLRTRERIKISTARMLEARGFHALRVIDITDDANIAEGSFYVYFKDKHEASIAVLSGLLLEFLDFSGSVPDDPSAFAAIRAANRRWISVCRSNSGLMRCVLQISDGEPQFGGLAQQSNRQWYERVADSVIRRRGGNRGGVLMAVYLLGSMMDELARKLVIYPDPELYKLLGELQADDTAVADAASVMWLRVLYPDERPSDDLPPAAAQLADILWPEPKARRSSRIDDAV